MPDFGPGPKLHLLKSRTNTVVHCCNSMASVQGTLGEMTSTGRAQAKTFDLYCREIASIQSDSVIKKTKAKYPPLRYL